MNICSVISSDNKSALMGLMVLSNNHNIISYSSKTWTLDSWVQIDLIILDAQNLSLAFLKFYREMSKIEGPKPILFLGEIDKSDLSIIPMDEKWCFYIDDVFDYHVICNKVNAIAEHLIRHTKPNSESIFEGLSSLKPVDLIQMLCQSRWCGQIKILDGSNKEADVFIAEGQIRHIVFQNELGQNAFIKICSWGKWNYRFKENSRTKQISVNVSWETLLIDTMKRMDEMEYENNLEINIQ